jgi:F0F1-type ATP synthase delta subunit
MKDTVVIESNKSIGKDNIGAIKSIIEKRFNITVVKIEEIINENIIGGIIININDYKILLVSNEIPVLERGNNNLTIESQRELLPDEKSQYVNFAKNKFSLPEDINVTYTLNNQILAGIKIRYKDEEVDLTLDKILDKAFSKI